VRRGDGVSPRGALLLGALVFGGLLLGTLGSLTSCASIAVAPHAPDPATWELAATAEVSAASTTIEVVATRLDCANGVTGDLEAPTVVYGVEEVVIRIDAAYDGDGAANCLGNDGVPVTVELAEPVGDRVLIDGACRETAATDTVFCEDPVRWRP